MSTSSVASVVSELVASSVVMNHLPEWPGYNGSVLHIDDVEATRVGKSIEAGLKVLEALHASHIALIEAADALLSNEDHRRSCEAHRYMKGSPTWCAWEDLREARDAAAAALTSTQPAPASPAAK